IGDLTPQDATRLGVKANKGVLVSKIVPDGPADKAGLRADDVIVAVNGKETDSRSLRLAVSSMAPGTTINLKVIHDGAEKNPSVTLDKMVDDNQRADEREQSPAPR